MIWYRHGYEVAKTMDRLIPLIMASVIGATKFTPEDMDCVTEQLYGVIYLGGMP